MVQPLNVAPLVGPHVSGDAGHDHQRVAGLRTPENGGNLLGIIDAAYPDQPAYDLDVVRQGEQGIEFQLRGDHHGCVVEGLDRAVAGERYVGRHVLRAVGLHGLEQPAGFGEHRVHVLVGKGLENMPGHTQGEPVRRGRIIIGFAIPGRRAAAR